MPVPQLNCGPEEDALAARRRHVWRLRTSGATVRQIAYALGISVGTAQGDLKQTLESLNTESQALALEYRSAQLDQLNALLCSLLPRATNPQAKGQDSAVERVLGVLARQSKLLGLDAAVKYEHTGAGGGPIQSESRLDLRETYTPDEALHVAAQLQGKLALLIANTERYGSGAAETKAAETGAGTPDAPQASPKTSPNLDGGAA